MRTVADLEHAISDLEHELDKLILLDHERNQVDKKAAELNAKRQKQVGRMEVLAEQAGVDLDEFVGRELKAGRAAKVIPQAEVEPDPG